MKHFIFFIATLLMLPFSGNIIAQSENLPSADSIQAEEVMYQYFAALAGGDVGTLETLLGGRLKAKRTPLLNNPEYAGYLATAYVNASFQILGIHSTAPSTVSVDVLVYFSPDETIHNTYTLMRNTSGNAAVPYHIVNEAAVAD
jgi:hypothetical protein